MTNKKPNPKALIKETLILTIAVAIIAAAVYFGQLDTSWMPN